LREQSTICVANPLFLGDDDVHTIVQPQALEHYGNGYTLAVPDECCWQQWEATGDITSFELGERNISDRVKDQLDRRSFE